ncbi:hypothetical protein [Actinotalea sp. K2]|nr:hypothetical protein [Actinotalea sp. K2]
MRIVELRQRRIDPEGGVDMTWVAELAMVVVIVQSSEEPSLTPA